METVIKLTGINKIYRTDEVETQALENVNLEVRKGEFLSIMGPSGCGKSTLLNIMGLLDEPTSGEIELCGTRIDPKLSDNRLAELRNKTLGFVFQSFHLIPTLNVLDNVQLPLIYRGVRSGERIRLAKEVIDRVGLSHRMKHRPTQLSGGQCQRVAIARAIIGNPEILLDGCGDHGTAPPPEPRGRPHHRHGDPQRAAGRPDRQDYQIPRRTTDTVIKEPQIIFDHEFHELHE